MADKKISELVSLAGKDVAATDFFPVVDVSVAETKSLTRDELRNAVNAIQFAATKALATTAAASLPDDTIIEVAADESLSGARTRYTVAAGALVFAYGVVTKDDLSDASDPTKGAALVGWLRTGADASPRTVAEKLGDFVTFADSGVPTDGVTEASSQIQKAIDELGARPFGGVLDGQGLTYLVNLAGVTHNVDNVLIQNFKLKRTSTASGPLLQFATTRDTSGGGVRRARFQGITTATGGNAGLMFGSVLYAANYYVATDVNADSFSQYGVGIGNGSNWFISNVSVTNHGLTSGSIASCMGVYVFPQLASSGGKAFGISSEISSASQANTSANHAAIKLETHSNLTVVGVRAVGGSEECVSIDAIGGTVLDLDITPQGQKPGLAISNSNTAHNFSGQTFTLDGIKIGGDSRFSLTIGSYAAKTISSVNTGTDTLTIAAHGWKTGMPVSYVTSGLQIGGLVADALYYIINPTADTIQLSTAVGGAAVDLTSAGSGTQQIQPTSLAGCTVRNVRGNVATLLNSGSFKNCTFEDWEFDSIGLHPTIAAVTPAVINSNGNTLINVRSRSRNLGDRFALKVSDSRIINCGAMAEVGKTVSAFETIDGSRNKRIGAPVNCITQYTDPASLADGAGALISFTLTATSGLSVGDFTTPAASSSVAGALLTSSVTSATTAAIRLQNESGSALDMDTTRFAMKKFRANEIRRYGAKAAYQFSAINIPNGGLLSTTVTVPGAALGDVALMAWKSPISNLIQFAYVSAADTVACLLCNKAGGPLNAVTATADLLACVLKEDKADYVNAVVCDPISLATASGDTVTVPVPGASPGDFALATFSLDLQNVILSAEISADGVASVRFQNETGSTVDLGSGVLKVVVYSAT